MKNVSFFELKLSHVHIGQRYEIMKIHNQFNPLWSLIWITFLISFQVKPIYIFPLLYMYDVTYVISW